MKKLLLLIAFILISCGTDSPTNISSGGDYQCAGYVFKCSGWYNDCKGTPNDRPECWKQCKNKVQEIGDYCKPTGHRWQCK